MRIDFSDKKFNSVGKIKTSGEKETERERERERERDAENKVEELVTKKRRLQCEPRKMSSKKEETRSEYKRISRDPEE